MRVWEKNYFYTLVLFVVFFFVCILIIVQTSFSAMMDTQRENDMNQAHFISRAIAADISALESRQADTTAALRNVVSLYSVYYGKTGISISLINNEGDIIHGSEEGNMKFTPDNAMVCSIQKKDTGKYINIIAPLQETSNDYYLIYEKNINALYHSHNRRTAFLVALSVGVSVILACGLYLTLKRLYRPLNNLAHELRTPLTSIQGYAQYLQIAALSEKERYSATKFIIDESRRLSDITSSLLIMANLREGSITYNKINIKEVFDSTEMTFKHVEYSVQQKNFFGDQTLLQSLVNNLVSNAVKASAEDNTIYLKAYDNIIEVTDHGKGMSEETLLHANNPSRQAKGGSGLGIPLCHQIAKLHKAKLSFESTPGEGTTARITFTTR